MIFDKISRPRRSTFWICLGLALVFMLSAVPGNFSYAKGRFMNEEWQVPKFYPQGFDGYGKIEKIEDNGVVIGDTAYKFSPGVKFATPRDRNAGIYAFSEGDIVAFLLNKDDEITSLWYIEFRKPR